MQVTSSYTEPTTKNAAGAPWKPELLAPAKNMERLQVAVSYGADAVYVGGQRYGLRARADNFSEDDLAAAVAFAHDHQAKVYVTLNAFLHDEDFEGLADYAQTLEAIGVDAVIASDLGVIRVVSAHSGLPVHLSTQASCLNVAAASLWKQTGVERLILGRELTVAEGGILRQQADIDVEMFIHGAMCMAFSGHCTISNYTAGRDSNRGGCIQSCRFPYEVEGADGQSSSTAPTLLSSKDLAGLREVPAFFENQICSLKIEGRMKSSFYVASTCQAYRMLIDAYAEGRWSEDLVQEAEQMVQAIPHRDYTSGSLHQPAGPDSVYLATSNTNVGTHQAVGTILDVQDDYVFMRLTAPLCQHDEIEFLPFGERPIRWQVDELFDIVGQAVSSLRTHSVARLPRHEALHTLAPLNVVRARHPEGSTTRP